MRYSITQQASYNAEKFTRRNKNMNLNQMKRKVIAILSMMAALLLAMVIPVKITTTSVVASTVSVNTLEVGDTFSGTFGTDNTDPMNSNRFNVDAITGLLAEVSDQILYQQYVDCIERGYIGLTDINAWSQGVKAEYTYHATVTDVQPDGTVTLSIFVPHYLKPGTNEEATGWSAIHGRTVPYQACAGTWIIRTAPRNITVNVTLDKSNGNPAMTQGNAACYAQDLSGAVYGVYSDAALTNEVGRITTDANGHGELNGITVQRTAVLYTKELVAPRGFGLDAQVYSHMFTANGETYNVQSTDVPLNDPLTITLNKVSADGTVVANPASLEGAEFTIKYYAGQYTFNDLPTAATRTWVIQTKLVGGRYFALMSDTYKVSGDPFYLDAGIPTLPLGTITVEETKAPTGYTLDNKVIDATNSPAPNIKDGVALFNIVDDWR